MPLIDVNGIDLYYETEGSGPAVILVTGFGGDVSFWRKVSETLSQKHKVIKIDNRGAGRTSYEGKFTLDDIATDILCLMEKLGIEKASIVGWSFGSHVAYKTALMAPDRIGALVLMSSFVHRPARSRYILSSALGLAEQGLSLEYLAKTINCLCYTEGFFRDMETSGKEIRLPDLISPAGLRDQLDAVELSRLDPADDNIEVPTLLIHGDEDIMVDCSEGLELAGMMPRCETMIIEGAGHHLPAERYVPALMRFIEDRI